MQFDPDPDTILTPENPDREAWLEQRRKGIGASDAAAVMGLDPYRSPLDVWLSKVHPEMLPEPENEELLQFGLDVEPAIAGAYERATKRQLQTVTPAIVHHQRYPEILCSPDRITMTGGPRLVQLKWESKFADKFGDPGTDQVPDAYLIQCAHEMSCVGCDFEDIATMHAGPPVLIYPLHRDRELEKEIIERLRAFWADYVLKDIEPPVDSSAAWSGYLERKFPENRGEIVQVDRGTEFTWADDLINIRYQREVIKRYEAELENKIKSFIGNRDGITGDFGTITWRKCKDTVEDLTDWKGLAEQLASSYLPKDADRQWPDLVEAFTQKSIVTRKGSRRFLIKQAK